MNGFRLEHITMAFDPLGEGAGIELFTFHKGGNRRSLFGIVYERLTAYPLKNRIWISLFFISGGLEW